MTAEQRRTAVTLAMETAGISERRACRYTGFGRSSQRYRTRRAPGSICANVSTRWPSCASAGAIAGWTGCCDAINGKFRDECLNENWFVILADARQTIEAWRIDYETVRPHSGLADRTPAEFARELDLTRPSTTLITGLK